MLGAAETQKREEQDTERREEDYLGHRNGTKVKQVRIQRKASASNCSGKPVIIHFPRREIEERDSDDEATGNGQCSGEAGRPQEIVNDEGKTNQVENRKPHSTDLFVPWRAGIENMAADVEMRLCVTVVKDESLPIKPSRRERNQNSCRGRNNDCFKAYSARLRKR